MPARPAISAALTCRNIEKAYEYFTSVLGFAGLGTWAGPDGKPMHAAAVLPTKVGQATVMFGSIENATSGEFGPVGDFGANLTKSPDTLGNGVGLWFNVPDADAYHAFVKKNGAQVEQAPTDQFWGDRTFTVRTPDGYFVHFASPIEGFEPPEGLGEAEGRGATQATAPGTVEIELPGST